MYIKDELKKYFKKKVHEFKEYISTDSTFIDPAKARLESIKSINPTTYDRYEKYHYQPGEMSKLDKVIGDLVENTINSVKKVIHNAS